MTVPASDDAVYGAGVSSRRESALEGHRAKSQRGALPGVRSAVAKPRLQEHAEPSGSSCLETPAISSHSARRERAERCGVTGSTEDGSTPEFRTNAFFRARSLRAELIVRLDREDEDTLCDKLRTCGEEFMLNCVSCGHVHRCERACNLKWCPVCARRRSAQRVSKYEHAAALMAWPLHVTLTRCNVGEITREHIRDLKRCAVRLRRTPLFRKCVKGGIVSLELTNTGKGWHPHLHLLIDCEWLSLTVTKPIRSDSRDRKKAKCQLASAELERVWSKIIGQLLSSVKVRRCSGAEAVREVLKYAVKPSDLIDSPDAIGPAIRAISDGRLSTPFGSLYGLRRQLDEPKRPPFKCPSCAETGTMIAEATTDRFFRDARDPKRRR